MAWPGELTDLLVCLDAAPLEPPVFAVGGQRLAEVLLNMRQAMEELSEAPVRAALGGALTGAQNEGRLTAAVNAEIPGSVFADETRDANTCDPCRAIDERYLGSTDEMDRVRQHYPGGGFGGYRGCKGGERCRGTIRFEWPPDLEPIDPDEPDPDEIVVEPNTVEFEEAMRELNERIAEIDRRLADDQRPKVKIPRKRVTKTDEYDDGHTAKQAELRRLITREPEATTRHNRSGYQGLTELVGVPGDQATEWFISKRIRSHSDDDTAGETTHAVADTDKEELANLVARAVGVDAPALVRAGPTHVYVEFVKGRTGSELPIADRWEVVESDDGHLLGLFDVIVANSDRNSSNWLVRDGRPVAIDHGYAWNEEVEPWGVSPFSEPFIDLDGRTSNGPRPTNPMSPADMALIRQRVMELRPDFDRLDRGGWHAHMVDRLDILAARSTGDRDRLAP